MKENIIHRKTCLLCESDRMELAVPLRPTPVADTYVTEDRLSEAQDLYPLDLYLCRHCGHVQLLDIVDPKLLFGEYIYSTSAFKGAVEHFRKYVAEVTRRYPSQNKGLVVDIGSNDGTALRFFKSEGLQVLGIDPAETIAQQATDSGIETIADFLTSKLAKEIRKQYGPARFVTANNVFAHSDQLPDMADGIYEMLADDGIFVFEVSYLVDIIENLLFDTVYHEHLCFHSIKPLQSFFMRHDLELIDIQRLPAKGGSIRGYVQRKDGPHTVAPIIGELLALEARLGLDQPKIFQDYTAKIERSKAELLDLLRELKNEGKTIAGFGASATVTTLIYNFELTPYISFLTDDNEARHGLYSPHSHIPVMPPSSIIDLKPDYVVILAWQYAEPIMKNHNDYLEKGGRFIVPLPKLTVL